MTGALMTVTSCKLMRNMTNDCLIFKVYLETFAIQLFAVSG